LQAIGHESYATNLPGHQFYEPCGVSTHFLYSGENRLITHALVRMNWLATGSMRAPGEGAGMLALECAMDELADSLGIDPVELRIRNDPEVDPEKGVPFSSRRLVDCLLAGAERFGWSERNPRPAQVREGDQWIGLGMAAASRSNVLAQSKTRVTLTPELRAVVETDMTDIGTGTYSVLAQVAGEMLGLPTNSVDVRIGDTDLPQGAGSGFEGGGQRRIVHLSRMRIHSRRAVEPDRVRPSRPAPERWRGDVRRPAVPNRGVHRRRDRGDRLSRAGRE